MAFRFRPFLDRCVSFLVQKKKTSAFRFWCFFRFVVAVLFHAQFRQKYYRVFVFAIRCGIFLVSPRNMRLIHLNRLHVFSECVTVVTDHKT